MVAPASHNGRRRRGTGERKPKDSASAECRTERTKDLLYESNDSREMEKCSISPALLLVSLDARDRYRLGQVASFSMGEGYNWNLSGLFRPVLCDRRHATLIPADRLRCH